MALDLSIKQILIITLSFAAILLGLVLLLQISKIKEIIPFNRPVFKEGLAVEIIPKSSQQGTIFVIEAISSEFREEQHLSLVIEKEAAVKEITLYDDGRHNDKEQNDGIYKGTLDSTNFEAGGYKIKSGEEILTTFNIFKPGCELIAGSQGENKINFVILPSEYSDYDEFKKDAIYMLKATRSSLLSMEPFKSNIDKFSFSIINTSADLECDVGCKGFSSSACCNNIAVHEEASQCDLDSIIVLINDNTFCGMAADYAKICAGNSFAPGVLSHELGHSFGDLADEYVYAEAYPGYQVNEEIAGPNCDFETCSKWSNITSECFKGCTFQNLYRSSETSIMKDITFPEFNLVSQNHLSSVIKSQIDTKEKISSDNSYLVKLKYEKGNLSIGNIFLKPVSSPINARKSDFTAEIKDSNENSLFKTRIYIPIVENFQNAENYPLVNEEFETIITLPYAANADKLELSKNEKLLASASLAIFSQSCGNNICEPSENHLDCSADCEIDNDNFCQAALCDPDCPSKAGCTIGRSYTIPIIILSLGFIGLLASIIFRRKK